MFVNPTTTAVAQPAATKADKTPKTTIGYVNHYIRLKDG